LSLLSAYNTLHSAQISSDYAKIYFESLMPQILLTTEHGIDVYSIYCKNFASMAEKNGMVIFSLRGIFSA